MMKTKALHLFHRSPPTPAGHEKTPPAASHDYGADGDAAVTRHGDAKTPIAGLITITAAAAAINDVTKGTGSR
ncbi:hypothetical protein QM467_15890 [Rhodoblastus sp. 17X3]|uniref:hypothetical protein n=1 Tax=Rhodoblastus sp. 17X3 TaxID=3047026 RepID=UPI0024B6AA76|nr:hypothetical protein [Rhodoblastus sp. 17X3]MDI9849537.1 hypothetical protein [Rhodoblastus sp. 17X3]